MKRKHKVYIKLNLLSLFFIAVSFISITLAWFAYSGISTVSTTVNVKAWNIEFMKDTEVVSNQIVISLDDVYPGMETVVEEVSIHNLGDSDAVLSYDILSARVLDQELDVSGVTLDEALSHDYPFHINIEVADRYVSHVDGVSEFSVSVSWPLDSLNDELDSKWGNDSYNFQQEELAKQQADPNYTPRTSLQIVISLKAEQFIDSPSSPDISYNEGDMILYDVVNNTRCESISDTCIRTFVIDPNNKISDTNVTLVPDVLRTYGMGTFADYATLLNTASASWNVDTRALTIEDVLAVISFDNKHSYLKRDTLSDVIIGKVYTPERMNMVIDKSKQYNGYFTFETESFPYLSSNKCYWINSEYDSTKAYALEKESDTTVKVYGKEKSEICSVLPVLVVPKENLQV